jgi:hypothetical protein
MTPAGTTESVTLTIFSCESSTAGIGTTQTVSSRAGPTGWLLLPT